MVNNPLFLLVRHLPLIAKSNPLLAPNDMIYAALGTNWEAKIKISIEKLTLRTVKTPTQHQHNKEHLLLAETIKSKRLVKWQSQKYGFENRSKLSFSFIDYFQRQIDIKEQTTST